MRKLENKKLDEIGKTLVKAGTLPSRDIEKIVASPALFDSVRARIAMEKARPARVSYFRPGLAAFASVALVVVVVAFVAFTSEPGIVATRVVPDAPKNSEPTRFLDPDKLVAVTPPVEDDDEAVRPERISTRPAARVSRPKQSFTQPIRYQDSFYAVSYAGDPHETERGSRIVRVDIPRSTLFAMGVNIPLENESTTVKADLLIGSDGVTRGIRVVE